MDTGDTNRTDQKFYLALQQLPFYYFKCYDVILWQGGSRLMLDAVSGHINLPFANHCPGPVPVLGAFSHLV